MGGEMKFRLFSKTFEVVDPIALIESYCFQSNFYVNFDLVNHEKGGQVNNVNTIGARMREETIKRCEKTIKETKVLDIFGYKYDLDGLLRLKSETRSSYVGKLWDDLIVKLDDITGVSLATATKVLHTLYPEIIPMLDSMLQEEYRSELKRQRIPWEPGAILTSYYTSLKENLDNLNFINKRLLSNSLIGLTRVRIFDILCWSYLKSEHLRLEKKVSWYTIKPTLL